MSKPFETPDEIEAYRQKCSQCGAEFYNLEPSSNPRGLCAMCHPRSRTIDGNTAEEHAYAAQFFGATVAENLRDGYVDHAAYHARSAWHCATLVERLSA